VSVLVNNTVDSRPFYHYKSKTSAIIRKIKKNNKKEDHLQVGFLKWVLLGWVYSCQPWFQRDFVEC